MKTVTATATNEQTGPLTQLVYEFFDAQRRAMEAGAKNLSDWDGMLEYIDPVNFKRVGAYLEELGWEDYRKFLTNWMAGGTRFEFTEFRISEVGDTVFQEIEERHFRGDEFIRKNVIAVYRFNSDRKLVHLDIYEQAKDTGQWIIEAAKAATE
jgi:limonene-1,2-epoxide hydrolase